MKVIFFILILLSLRTSAGNDHPQDRKKIISGKVLAADGEEIAAAKILIRETNQEYFTDMDGGFHFALQSDKPYTIAVEVIGYLPKEVKSSELGAFSEISLSEL